MGVGVKVVDVMGSDTRRGSLISFYAAGIGVMFLLFSAVGGAGAVILEEIEAGTFERAAVDAHRYDRRAARQVAVPRIYRRGCSSP